MSSELASPLTPADLSEIVDRATGINRKAGPTVNVEVHLALATQRLIAIDCYTTDPTKDRSLADRVFRDRRPTDPYERHLIDSFLEACDSARTNIPANLWKAPERPAWTLGQHLPAQVQVDVAALAKATSNSNNPRGQAFANALALTNATHDDLRTVDTDKLAAAYSFVLDELQRLEVARVKSTPDAPAIFADGVPTVNEAIHEVSLKMIELLSDATRALRNMGETKTSDPALTDESIAHQAKKPMTRFSNRLNRKLAACAAWGSAMIGFFGTEIAALSLGASTSTALVTMVAVGATATVVGTTAAVETVWRADRGNREIAQRSFAEYASLREQRVGLEQDVAEHSALIDYVQKTLSGPKAVLEAEITRRVLTEPGLERTRTWLLTQVGSQPENPVAFARWAEIAAGGVAVAYDPTLETPATTSANIADFRRETQSVEPPRFERQTLELGGRDSIGLA